MMRRLQGLAARFGDERGMSLAEILIAASLMMILLGASLGFLESASRAVGIAGREQRSLDDARTTLARLEHEVRAAASVADASVACPASTCLIVTIPAGGGLLEDIRYRYDEPSKTLYRATGNLLLDDWGADAAAVTNLVNSSTPVFCRASNCTTPNERSIQIVLDINVYPSGPTQTIRLQSYATPRNL